MVFFFFLFLQKFRKLILKYHPDKNRGDSQANAKFIIITKAYECLTDPKTRAIYEKYGNPDGPGSKSNFF